MPEIYRHADCLVHPSLFEGMPNTVMEAMASNLPVIASDIPGNDMAVEHGHTGLLFDLADEDGLCRAVIKLLADRDLAREMGRRGPERVKARLTWQATAQSYIDLFERHYATR